MTKATDVVFLVPGFLGFERFDDYAYFGDRVSTALRAALSQRFGRVVPVVPVPIPPTGSLAARQRALASTLSSRTRELAALYGGEPERIHLIGHSTGGVDAHLLTLEHPLDPDTQWSTLGHGGTSFTSFRARIRSVTSIAAPHHGTCLADDGIAQLLASNSLSEVVHGARDVAAEVGRALLSIGRALPGLLRDDDVHDLVRGVLHADNTLGFLWNLRSRELIRDLSPARSAERYQKHGPALADVLRRSFVTVAGITPSASESSTDAALSSQKRASSPPDEHERNQAPFSPPDALFLLLSQLTSGRMTQCFAQTELFAAEALINRAVRDPAQRIVARAALLPEHIDAASNDGIVNTLRQLIDDRDPHELAGVVVADHFDVVGHYDKRIWVTDAKTGTDRPEDQRAGLLHSGSEFRDDQFFELVARVVDAMAPAL